MVKAKQGKEILVRTINDIGLLAEMSRSLSQRGIGIMAMSAWVEGEDAVIHLVTDDNLRAMEALDPKFSSRESGVITVEIQNKPGMLRRLSETLKKEEIDIHHLYATALPNQENCLVVFSSSNNDRALLLLNR